MTFSHHVVTIEEALSGIFGSISLTAWICLLVGPSILGVYFESRSSELFNNTASQSGSPTDVRHQIPQLITNYKTKSADGLSMLFLAVWLFGDIANLSGALCRVALRYVTPVIPPLLHPSAHVHNV